MDANGTRYHLLLGRADWAACQDDLGRPILEAGSPPAERALHWDEARSELTLTPTPFLFKAAAGDRPPRPEQRRGAARDRFGNWYWIAASEREIRVLSSGTGRAGHFWSAADQAAGRPEPPPGPFRPVTSAPPPAAQRYAGLCVTDDHYLVVGVPELPGLLVFDLYGGGPPHELRWRDGAISPFELAPRPGGGVWILDTAHGALWALDRNLDPVTPPPGSEEPHALAPFQPKAGGEPRYEAGLPRPLPTPLGLSGVVALEPLRGAEVLLMTEDGRLYRLRCGGAPDAIPEPPLATLALAHDFAFVAAPEPHAVAGGRLLGRVYRLTREGNQAIAHELVEDEAGALDLRPVFRYYPVRRFGGKALVAAGGGAYYDLDERWLPVVEQPRPAYGPSGTLISPVFDGKEPGCVWHRLLLDACIPAEARVRVWSRASDDRASLGAPPPQSPPEGYAFAEEPPLYARSDGPELPFVALPEGFRTHELLLQHARGRYLQLQLELSGNARVTPHLRALRVYYPRFSYLRYLPALYREEDVGQGHVLERFLANPEGIYTALEDRIANVQVLFDPRTAPAEALEWLGRWLGVALDPAWSEAKRRLFLRHAPLFFRYRGTLRGLLMALRLAFDDCAEEAIFTDPDLEAPHAWSVRLVEHFRTRLPAPAGGDPLALDAADTERWREFLARRYRTVEALNAAYGASFAAFAEVPAPAAAPPAGARLTDWRQFRRLLLPLARAAHSFSVLVPVTAGQAGGEAAQQARLELARRVVELEKPAHTRFDLRFFWALFRVGEARLGQDTRLDQGSSRVPDLMKPAVLGSGYLAESYLAYRRAPGRRVLDQDPL